MRSCLWNGCLQLFDPAFFRSLSGKSIYLWKLCGSPCLCGGIAKENAHHRGTEIAQRTTETNSSTDSFRRLDQILSYPLPRREKAVSKVKDATGFSRVEIQLEPN